MGSWYIPPVYSGNKALKSIPRKDPEPGTQYLRERITETQPPGNGSRTRQGNGQDDPRHHLPGGVPGGRFEGGGGGFEEGLRYGLPQ